MSAAEAATDAAKTVISAAIELIEDFTGAPWKRRCKNGDPNLKRATTVASYNIDLAGRLSERKALGGCMGCTRELAMTL
jgi:hypothetical protein